MTTLIILLVILAVTRAGAELAERAGQPSLVGELIAGVSLGAMFSGLSQGLAELDPTLIQNGGGGPLTCGGLVNENVFRSFTDLGVFFLMLLAGMEVQPQELTQSSRKGFPIGLGGLLLPFLLGCAFAAAILPETPHRLALIVFMGTALSITAVPIAAKVLMDLGMMRSVPGQAILSAALFDDLLSLMVMAGLTALIRTGHVPDGAELMTIMLKVAAFIGIVAVIGYLVFPVVVPMLDSMSAPEFEMSMLLVAALAFAVLAEALGLHFILGAFAAGMFFANARTNEHAFRLTQQKISGCTYGLLAPIFFASIGLQADFGALFATPELVVTLIVIAILGKLIGAGLPAYWLGMSRRDATAVGVGMTGRGAVELIIADIALEAGLFRTTEPSPIIDNLFSAVVIMAIVTTILMPVGLKFVLDSRPAP